MFNVNAKGLGQSRDFSPPSPYLCCPVDSWLGTNITEVIFGLWFEVKKQTRRCDHSIFVLSHQYSIDAWGKKQHLRSRTNSKGKWKGAFTRAHQQQLTSGDTLITVNNQLLVFTPAVMHVFPMISPTSTRSLGPGQLFHHAAHPRSS